MRFSRRSLLRRSAGACVTLAVDHALEAARRTEPDRSGPDGAGPAVSNDDLERAVQAAPPGSTLRLRGVWSRSTPLVVDRPLTMVFESGSSITMTRDVTAIEVLTGSVAVIGARLVGAGAAASGLGRGVHVRGTAEEPLEDVHVVDCVVRNFSYDALQFEHVRDFVVARNTVTDLGYAGIMLLSSTDGQVVDNEVRDVHQPDGYVNSYGVIVSRDDRRDLSAAPRSARVRVERNRISGVRRWEGIDTHSGDDVTICDNTVRDCRVGIAVVPSKDPGDRSYRIGSHRAVIARNRIERNEVLPPGSGIVVRGAGSRLGDDLDRTDAVVTGNVVVGHGGGPREAGILAYFTRGLTLSDNHLDRCERAAISLYHSNDAAIVTRNSVSGLGRSEPAQMTVAIEAPSAGTSAQVLATRVRPATDGTLCSVGLVCGTGSTVTALANDWSGAARPVGGGGTIDRCSDG